MDKAYELVEGIRINTGMSHLYKDRPVNDFIK